LIIRQFRVVHKYVIEINEINVFLSKKLTVFPLKHLPNPTLWRHVYNIGIGILGNSSYNFHGQMERQLLQWIYEINFTNQDAPVFEMYQEEDVDLTLAQRDKIISECGVKFTKEYFIKAFGYDAEDFDIHAEFQGSTPFCQEILAGCIHHSKPRTARQECCKIIENAPSDSQFSQFKEEPEIEGQVQIYVSLKFSPTLRYFF